MGLSMSWSWMVLLLAPFSPLVVIASHSAADYYVHDLPGVPEDAPQIKMHAGHIEIDREHNGNIFFWHFQNQHIADRQRTVIWLNGGPGCSSEDGALMEVGPYRLKDEETLTFNNGSWNKFANLLFVDNPVGTGFSYVDSDNYTRSLPEMASQFVIFLENFFAVFPEYEQDDIYLAGESYAGQYIPYIAKAILNRNEARKRIFSEPWNLKGLLIGNGWMSPKDQYEAYLTYTIEKGLVQEGTDEGDKLQSLLQDCHQEMGESPILTEYSNCSKIRAMMSEIGRNGESDESCYNIYDVRLKDSYPSCGMNWPPDLQFATPYLRRPDVAAQLNVQNHSGSGWQECVGSVGQALRPSGDAPSVRLLPELLEELPILLFSGAEDLSCNHIGTENMINNLEWSGAKGFLDPSDNSTRRRYWTFDDEPAGFWQEARNLTYVLFYNASHMVPLDYPRRSLDMLNRFMGVEMDKIAGLLADSQVDGDEVSEGASGVHHSSSGEPSSNSTAIACVACRETAHMFLFFGIFGFGAAIYAVWQWCKGSSSTKRRQRTDDEEERFHLTGIL